MMAHTCGLFVPSLRAVLQQYTEWPENLFLLSNVIFTPTQFSVGGLGVGMALGGLLSEAGGAYWPLAIYTCPFLEPFPSVGSSAIELSLPRAPDPPLLPIRTSLHPLPFLWEVAPTERPDCPCFTALWTRTVRRREC